MSRKFRYSRYLKHFKQKLKEISLRSISKDTKKLIILKNTRFENEK